MNMAMAHRHRHRRRTRGTLLPSWTSLFALGMATALLMAVLGRSDAWPTTRGGLGTTSTSTRTSSSSSTTSSSSSTSTTHGRCYARAHRRPYPSTSTAATAATATATAATAATASTRTRTRTIMASGADDDEGGEGGGGYDWASILGGLDDQPSRMHQEWTLEDDKALWQGYVAGRSMEELADELERGLGGVKARVKLLGDPNKSEHPAQVRRQRTNETDEPTNQHPPAHLPTACRQSPPTAYHPPRRVTR